MTDFGHVMGSGTIRFERLLPGPIERVWEYLTDSTLRGRWLASGPMELLAGGRVELHFHHSDLSPMREEVPERYRQYEGSVVPGRVVRCDPPRVLAYTWVEGTDRESEVTFELSATGDGVRLVLTHRLLEDGEEMLGVASGWHTHLEVLSDDLNGKVPSPFWSAHARLEAEYARLLQGR